MSRDRVEAKKPKSRASAKKAPEDPKAPSGPKISRLFIGLPWLPSVIALVIPGAGHASLGRWRRGLLFAGLILFSLAFGCWLDGKLFVAVAEQPLSRLGTLASMAMGLPYFILRYGLEYQGDLQSAGYEYGTAFILTAGLMNVLVVIDCFDIVVGRKQ